MLRHLTTHDQNGMNSTCASLSARIDATEEGQTLLAARVAGVETDVAALKTWRDSKAPYLGAALKTDYNAVTTLLGALVGAVNLTNGRVNAIQSALETRGITAAAA